MGMTIICRICGTRHSEFSDCTACKRYYEQAIARGEIVFGLKRKDFAMSTWELAQSMSNEGASLEEIEKAVDAHAAKVARARSESDPDKRKNEEFRKRNGYV